jgi:hypothetical protein
VFWIRRLVRRDDFVFLAGALMLAAAASAFYLWSRPATLTVAVAPRNGPEARLLQAYADALQQTKKSLRVQLALFDELQESADALARRNVDLAVIRPDVLLPENGLSIAVLRLEALLILAPAMSGVAAVGDLARKRLGVIARHRSDPDFVARILAHYEMSPAQVGLVSVTAEEAPAALAAKRIDAVAMIALPTGPAARDLARAIEARVPDRKIVVVPVQEADALTLDNPAVVPITIPAGALDGRPKLPAEDVKTVGVSYRLMARSDLDRDRVSLATEYLFEMRTRLARATPAAYQMKPPEFDSAVTATSAALPNHAGAVDYFQREQQTFFQRYGDWIYLLMFSGGGIFSAVAWIAQRFARKRRELVDRVLDRLLDILTEARSVTEVADLDRLSLEVDNLVTHAVRYARHHTAGPHSLSALILAIDSSRAAIADRRRDVVGHAAEDPCRGLGRVATLEALGRAG